MQEIVIESNIDINNMIYEVRGKQIILDSDLAKLYRVETKRINEAVKNNIKKFKVEYCFRLSEYEYNFLKSKNSSSKGGSRKGHNAFTEEGVLMLTTILKSNIAIEMSIKIIDAFVEMKKFIYNNLDNFSEIATIRSMPLDHDSKINELFNIFDNKKVSTSKIFYEGEIYDSYSLLVNIIKEASEKIIIIDNYIDDSILDILINKNDKVSVLIVTKEKSIQKLSVDKFNKQYKNLEIKISNTFHDRFLIIDNSLYHIGASLKDLGNKCFCISKINDNNYFKNLIENL